MVPVSSPEQKSGWSKIPPPKEVDTNRNRPSHLRRPSFPPGAFATEPMLLSPTTKSLGELQFAKRSTADIPQSPLVRHKSDRTLTEGRGLRLKKRPPKAKEAQEPANTQRKPKRAVLVGASYSGTSGVSTFPDTADLSMLHDLLVFQFGFKTEDVWILTDEPQAIVGAACRFRATRAIIINAMQWLVSNSRRGEMLLFSFSGHSRSIGAEDDIMSPENREGIIPTDYPIAPPITADEIHETLVQGLADGATLLALFNCHPSSRIMKLPYVYAPCRTKHGLFRFFEELDAMEGHFASPGAIVMNSVLRFSKVKKEAQLQLQRKAIEKRDKLAAECFENGTVICISMGSGHNSTSATSSSADDGGFSLTSSFVRYLKHCVGQKEHPSYDSMLSAISLSMLTRGEDTLPRLSSSHKFNLESTISL